MRTGLRTYDLRMILTLGEIQPSAKFIRIRERSHIILSELIIQLEMKGATSDATQKVKKATQR